MVEESSCKGMPNSATWRIRGRDHGKGGEAREGVEETWYCAFMCRRRTCLRELWATWGALKGIWWPPQPAEEVYSHKPSTRHVRSYLKLLSIRSTGALKNRGIRDPGLFVRRVLFTLMGFGLSCEQDCILLYYKLGMSPYPPGGF
jgi:hypothetical protein